MLDGLKKCLQRNLICLMICGYHYWNKRGIFSPHKTCKILDNPFEEKLARLLVNNI